MVVEVPFFCGFAKLSWYWTTFSISMVRIVAGGVWAEAMDQSTAVKVRLARTTRCRTMLFRFVLNTLRVSSRIGGVTITARIRRFFSKLMSVVSFFKPRRSNCARRMVYTTLGQQFQSLERGEKTLKEL